ncbi:hypothetical protein [Leptodesmis sichuanensis]|uniref:hypothetical protein n=1 Tax=Leptodesmis sichuanensis TaxID=2906798 RepID=UPI001F195E9D|nr:hypothetical protein [Leptodesmis sichuanensis]UIE38574.1 hypothetical protein KIK02_02725 [Leptodesmis sichuanensis A121]
MNSTSRFGGDSLRDGKADRTPTSHAHATVRKTQTVRRSPPNTFWDAQRSPITLINSTPSSSRYRCGTYHFGCSLLYTELLGSGGDSLRDGKAERTPTNIAQTTQASGSTRLKNLVAKAG